MNKAAWSAISQAPSLHVTKRISFQARLSVPYLNGETFSCANERRTARIRRRNCSFLVALVIVLGGIYGHVRRRNLQDGHVLAGATGAICHSERISCCWRDRGIPSLARSVNVSCRRSHGGLAHVLRRQRCQPTRRPLPAVQRPSRRLEDRDPTSNRARLFDR